MGTRRDAGLKLRTLVIIVFVSLVAHLVIFWQRLMMCSSQPTPTFQAVQDNPQASMLLKLHEIGRKLDGMLDGSFMRTGDPNVVNVLREMRSQLGDVAGSVCDRNVVKSTGVATEDVSGKIEETIARSREESDAVFRRDRKKIRVFVGVFTGFNDPGKTAKDAAEADRYDYTKRRQALRDTWFPGTPESRDKLEREKGIVVRFVVGHSKDPTQEEVMGAEERKYKDFIRLPVMESYHGLANKTKNFFATALSMYDPDWVVKVDDDVYLMVERILLVAKQWEKMGADYIGCMKHGVVWKEEGTRWYEPKHLLLGNEYYLHAYGSIYVMSRKTVEEVIVRNFNNLRVLANEDTTVGSWMLGHNVTHFEDMRLCATKCSNRAVGILRNECAGLCNPLKDLYLVHNHKSCQLPAAEPVPYLPSYPEHTAFEAMRV